MNEDSSGFVVLQNYDDFSLHTVEWRFRVIVTTLETKYPATQSGQFDFAVTWKDPCYDSELAPAHWNDVPTSIFLH